MRSQIEQADGALLASELNGPTVDLHPGIGLPVPVDRHLEGVLPTGHVLRGRYVIQGILGYGGKGIVYQALDRYRSALPPAHQQVALKVLHPGGECAARTLEQLGLELHCGQALSHRNIVNVYELDRDDELVFFTMELLDGELLSEVIARRHPAALPPTQAWHLVRQMGAGLQHAHERGIVHGDLKPRNLLVTRDGDIRILDFSSARHMDDPPWREGRSDGAVRGTPAYASCEQLEGLAPDPRDDLYALACITYELLTGEHPFAHRPATVARNYGVQAERPAGLSRGQWRTLQVGLAWHRATRSTSVHAWVQKLAGDAAEPPAPHRRGWLNARTAFVSAAALVLAGVAVVALWHAAQTPGNESDRGVTIAKDRHAPDPAPAVPAQDPHAAQARAADADHPVHPMARTKPSAMPAPIMISVDGYQINPGDRFAEIRVKRNRSQDSSPFVWWTEPATATQGVDYVPQSKAIQSFLKGRRSTHLYVKLLPDPERSRRGYFYVAIAQPGRRREAHRVVRTPIWLPAPRNPLQARR